MIGLLRREFLQAVAVFGLLGKKLTKKKSTEKSSSEVRVRVVHRDTTVALYGVDESFKVSEIPASSGLVASVFGLLGIDILTLGPLRLVMDGRSSGSKDNIGEVIKAVTKKILGHHYDSKEIEKALNTGVRDADSLIYPQRQVKRVLSLSDINEWRIPTVRIPTKCDGSFKTVQEIGESRRLKGEQT